MWINPATHSVRFSGTTDAGTIGEFTVQYLVMDGANVVRKDTASFLIAAGATATMNPTLDAGQSWQIQSIQFLSSGTVSFAVRRITTDGNSAGNICKGSCLVNEWAMYADYTLTRYTTDGVPYPLPSEGSAPSSSTPAPLVIPFHGDATANVTLTNQAVAEQFLGNSNRNITVVDLDGYTECRLVARVVTGSASVNNPRIIAKFNSTYSTAVGDYANLGTSEVSCSLSGAVGVETSGWIPLAAGAIDTGRYVTVTQVGGDAAADPALGSVYLYVR